MWGGGDGVGAPMSAEVGSEAAAYKSGKQFNYNDAIPGGLGVHGSGGGPSGGLTGGAAERGVFGGLGSLLTPWAEPRFRAVPK